MYALYLNPVTAAAETYEPVAISDTKEKLEKLLEDESCEGYNDGAYFRSYRIGALYNYNPPSMNGINLFGVYEGIVKISSMEEVQEKAKLYVQQELALMEQHYKESLRI